MKLTIPRLEVRGKYDVDGSLLLLNVVSNGEFWAEFSKFLRKLFILLTIYLIN